MLSAEMALYEDVAPASCHKSYAQVLKDRFVPPESQPNWDKILKGIAVKAPEDSQGEDWTDVSSVTSCGWPATASVLTEKKEEETKEDAEVGKMERYPKDGVSVNNTIVRRQTLEILPAALPPKSVKDIPWVDQDLDTRLPRALHEEITHINRSRRMYNTMHPEYTFGIRPVADDDSVLEIKKPWRKWPGKRLYREDRYTQNQEEARDKRIQRAEWKKASDDMV